MQSMQSPRLIAVGPMGPDMANAALLQGPYPFMGSAQQLQQVQQIFQGQGMPYPQNMQGGKGGGTGTRSGVCASRHMAAEQRRRARINERLEALRSLVPHSARANTAAFLEEVYEYITALHKQLERLGGGPFATPGPSPPTAMLEPPAHGKAAGVQMAGNKHDRSPSDESDMQGGSGLEEMAKGQFTPFLQAAMMPGSPLFGATTSGTSSGVGMVMPELSLRAMMSEAPKPVGPSGQQRMSGNGFEGSEGLLQRVASPAVQEQSAGDMGTASGPGPSNDLTGDLNQLEVLQQEREMSAELEGGNGSGFGHEEGVAEEEMAAPRKRAKKSGPTVEMCGMKARNVQGVHRPIAMKPQA